MRTVLLSFLLFSLLIACQSADVGPSRLFYKTWERQPVTSTGLSQLLTFRADGQVRYGANQAEAGCCYPDRFRFTNNQLSLLTDYAKPACAYVYCGQTDLPADSPWQIETLSSTELIISNKDQRILFKSR
ncbi:hypothetical protein FAES_1945 [Fibrella aestuarina BUZ 2]|uniref:DUF306 domain-containing protein n=1 Tax=Fibrella aestuarina BUZ 2 TaxID=1166018 RepID=I0K751_9BACT|nr:hypothetical protein [Fibrella aestuarina]CCG99954.1 hypothetical protein FAES_1945 [Fibrella aestuarina BUZ 2]